MVEWFNVKSMASNTFQSGVGENVWTLFILPHNKNSLILKERIRRFMSQEIQNAVNTLRGDFERYASVNLKIIDKQSNSVSLRLNRMQQTLWKLYQKDSNNLKPIRWYITKSRQLGSTTFALALVYWRTTLNRFHSSLIVNYDFKAVQNLAGKTQNFYLHSNPLLQPKYRKMNRDEVHFATPLDTFEKTGEVGLDSRIIFTTADAENLGRSYTFQTVLLSEFSLWEELGIDPEKKLIALNSAIPENNDTAVIIETTPNGEGFAKSFWEDVQNGYRKIFISWIADDTYTISLSDNDFKLFEYSTDKDSKYGDEYQEREFIITQLRFWFPEKIDDLHWLDQEAVCRLSWRRHMIDQKLGGKKEAFDAEYPTTPEKMWAGSTGSIFGSFKIQELLKENISNNLKPVKYEYVHDDSTLDVNQKFFEARYGDLLLYEEPELNQNYVIGGDGAQGIENGDESSLVILKVPQMLEVASYSGIIRPDIFAGLAHFLSILYNYALLAVEVNDKGGFTSVSDLQNKYFNRNLYFQGTHASKIRYGWYTNAITRQVMINDLMALVSDDQIFIRSRKILEQMNTFVKLNSGKIAAMSGKHDDLVLSLMIALQLCKLVNTNDYKQVIKRQPKYSIDWWVRQNNQQRLERAFAK